MPKLATTLTTLDGLPEGLGEYYERVDANDESAGFQLLTDNSANRTKIGEFRQTNNRLKQQIEGLESKIGKLDGVEDRLAGLDKLLAQAQTAEDKTAIEAGDIDKVVERRTAEALRSGEQRFAALQTQHEAAVAERDRYRQRVGQSQVRDAMTSALDGAKARVRPGAMPDLMRRASDVWSVNEHDQLVAKEADGSVMYGEKGQPMAMAEYASKLANDAPHFFEAGQGAGSPGNRSDRVVAGRGQIGVDMSNPLSIGKNLDKLREKKAVLVPGS